MMFIAVFQTLNGSDDKCLRVDHSAIWLTLYCKFLMPLWSKVKAAYQVTKMKIPYYQVFLVSFNQKLDLNLKEAK